jgi:hypothetical protein
METKRNHHILFLDINIYSKPDRSLGHEVYCKPSALTSTSIPMLTTILPINRLYFPCWCTQPDPFMTRKLNSEQEFLRTTFRQTGYSD